jgi:hypothetical protein
METGMGYGDGSSVGWTGTDLGGHTNAITGIDRTRVGQPRRVGLVRVSLTFPAVRRG